jgi:YVTN family beta-propeller protein
MACFLRTWAAQSSRRLHVKAIGKAWASLATALVLSEGGVTAKAYEVWVTNQRTNKIQIVDGGSLHVVGEIDAGQKPHNLTFSKDGKIAYVAELRSNAVTVIDAVARRSIATIPAGKTTHQIAISPDQQSLLVVNRGDDTVTVVDAGSLRKLKVIPVGKRPNMALFAPDGKRAYVTNSGDGTLSVFDTRTWIVSETIQGMGRDVSSMAVSRDGRKLIVIATGEDEYRILDAATPRTVARGPTGRDPRSLALTADGGQALIANRASNSLTIVDMTSGRAVGTIEKVGDKPSTVAVAPDGRRAFAALIGARATDDPPHRLSGKDAAVAVVDLAAKRKIAAVSLGGDPYAVAVRD